MRGRLAKGCNYEHGGVTLDHPSSYKPVDGFRSYPGHSLHVRTHLVPKLRVLPERSGALRAVHDLRGDERQNGSPHAERGEL